MRRARPLLIRFAVKGGGRGASDGSPMALGSTSTHEVWVKQVIPHQGATPLTELQMLANTIKYR